jgi:hypothetical protein
MKITSKTRLQGSTPEDSINPSSETTLAKIPGLSVPIHDFLSLSYTGDNLTQVVYKTGGSEGQVVCTLTLEYDINDKLISVSKE